MKIIITESQFKNIKSNHNFIRLTEDIIDYEPCSRGGNLQIHPEDIIFFEKFFNKYGFLPYPKEMERLGNHVKIGNIYPEHPMSHLTTKSYYICKSKVFKEMRSISAENLGLILSDTIRGSKRYITNDGKHQLRSIFEVIFYNIFEMNGESDKLEVDSRKFYGQCNEIKKEVDFIYNDKTVIEIAGMASDEYYNKLESAMKCIESLGYNTIMYKIRGLNKSTAYFEFYKNVCEDFNFPINKEILTDPSLLIGHRNLQITTMVEFIDNNIEMVTQNSDPKKYYALRMFIKKLYGKSVNEYRKEKGIKQRNR